MSDDRQKYVSRKEKVLVECVKVTQLGIELKIEERSYYWVLSNGNTSVEEGVNYVANKELE